MTRILMLVLVVATAACVTPPTVGAPLPENQPVPSVGRWFHVLAETVSFEHGCPRERILFIRGYGRDSEALAETQDLDVCGTVRRYKGIGGAWVDVTSLYPASSLPPPLQK